LIIEVGAASVRSDKTVIDLSCAMFDESENVGDDGNVEKHTPLKDDGARGGTFESTVGSASTSEQSCGDSIVDDMSGLSCVEGDTCVHVCANNLTDGPMNGLNDRVGGRCMWSDIGTFNAGFGETELEDVVFKFGTSVVNDTLRTRVSGEPMVLE